MILARLLMLLLLQTINGLADQLVAPPNPSQHSLPEDILTHEQPRPPPAHYYTRALTVFDEQPEGMSFEEKVIAIEGHVAGTVCGDSGFPSPSLRKRGNRNIEPCYCDQACVILHNCCPDVLIQNMASHDQGHGSECVGMVPTGVNMSAFRQGDLQTMVTKCPDLIPPHEQDAEFQIVTEDELSKCDEADPSDPVQALPVSATETKITYRNIFCAKCNNVNITDTETFQNWDPMVKCTRGMAALLNGNPDTAEIYRRLNSKQDILRTKCELKYTSSLYSGFQKPCRYTGTSLVERCNQTGKWETFDSRIDKACSLYTSIVFNQYKNVFCFMCNTGRQFNLNLLNYEVNRGGGVDHIHTARLSFEALLDFSDAYAAKESNKGIATAEEAVLCQQNQVYNNVSCTCQDVKCSEGKSLSRKNASECISAMTSNYLGYSICFQVDLAFNQPVWDIEDLVDETAIRLFLCCSQGIFLQVTARSWCPGDTILSLNIEIMDFYENGYITMSEYDKRARDVIMRVMRTSESWLLKDVASHEISLSTNCPKDYLVTKPCMNDVDNNMTIPGRRKLSNLMNSLDYILNTVHFIPFRITNLCPHVDLPANEFEKGNDSFRHISTGFDIGNDRVDTIDNVTFRVCREAFVDAMSQLDKSTCAKVVTNLDQEDFDNWTVEGLVSIVCTCLSLFCLFLTFLTYLIFKSLRDASGKNIMALTLLLFFAQAFFEFAMEQFENETACSFFGISIHYFWLAAVFSMNACTVERFYKLCFPLKSRAFFYSNKPFVVATVYSLVSPFILIAINILTNYETTGHIGYGSARICYINNLYSRIFAFAVPLAVLLLTNAILFAVTIYSIRRHTVPGHKSKSMRVSIKACVQLSFVTGLTWLLAFLYEFISVSGLGYVFTALIGLQGVLFFYSIVLNKRVINLYKGLWGLESNVSSSGSKGIMSGSSGSADTVGAHKTRVAKKQNPVYKISFTKKNAHSDVTQTSIADSGVEM